MRVVAGFGLLFLLSGVSGFAQAAPAMNRNALQVDSAANVNCIPSSLLPDKGGRNGKGAPANVCSTKVEDRSWYFDSGVYMDMVQACPLDMHVRQRAGGSLMSTDAQGRPVKTFAARLKLELTDQRPDKTGQRMVSATVTVRGWNPNARALPIDGGRGDSLARTMTVPLTGGGIPDASADLELPGFTAARMVRLDSITYDDGQVWRFRSCQAAPDLYMPVEGSK
jgi:hypothetical protein